MAELSEVCVKLHAVVWGVNEGGIVDQQLRAKGNDSSLDGSCTSSVQGEDVVLDDGSCTSSVQGEGVVLDDGSCTSSVHCRTQQHLRASYLKGSWAVLVVLILIAVLPPDQPLPIQLAWTGDCHVLHFFAIDDCHASWP